MTRVGGGELRAAIKLSNHTTLVIPTRSEAEWRDLRLPSEVWDTDGSMSKL